MPPTRLIMSFILSSYNIWLNQSRLTVCSVKRIASILTWLIATTMFSCNLGLFFWVVQPLINDMINIILGGTVLSCGQSSCPKSYTLWLQYLHKKEDSVADRQRNYFLIKAAVFGLIVSTILLTVQGSKQVIATALDKPFFFSTQKSWYIIFSQKYMLRVLIGIALLRYRKKKKS